MPGKGKGRGRAEGKWNKSMTKGYIEEKQRQLGENWDSIRYRTRTDKAPTSKRDRAKMEALMKKLKQLEGMKGSAPAYSEKDSAK